LQSFPKQNEGSSFSNPALGNVFNKYYKSFSLENVFLYNGVNDVLVKKLDLLTTVIMNISSWMK
jgi:hypothetical protein